MRKILIIFLLFINFLFGCSYSQPILSNVKDQTCYSQINNFSKSSNIITVDFKGYENALLKLNTNNETLKSILSENNNKNFGFEYNISNNYIKNYKFINYEKILLIKSSSISPYLTYVISIRAP